MVLASKTQAEGFTSSSKLAVLGHLSQIGSETQFFESQECRDRVEVAIFTGRGCSLTVSSSRKVTG